MTGTISLASLAQEIEQREERKQDYIIQPERLTVFPSEVAEGGDGEIIRTAGVNIPDLEISDVAHRQLASWSPIGSRYYDIMRAEAPEMWAQNVNHWLRDANERAPAGQHATARMLRTLKPTDQDNGNPATLRAFVSDKYGRFEDVHLLRPVLERAEAHGWTISHCALTEKRMHIRVAFPNMTADVKVGDPVRLGAAFSNSEVGLGSWQFMAFVERLVCLNGMVVRDKAASFGRRHLTSRQSAGWLSSSTLALEDQLLQAQVGDTLEAMTDGNRFARLVAQMTETTQEEIEHPTEAVAALARRASLTQDETEQVVREQIRGGDPSLWGLVNALTATARDLPSFERRAELETAAGTILTSAPYRRELTEAGKELSA